MEFHLETSIVGWIENYFQETLVPPLYMWHSSSVWKTSKTDSLPISLPPNHLIILKSGGNSLQPPLLSAVNYYNHLSLNCTPKKFCSKSNFSYFIWIMYKKNVYVCTDSKINSTIINPVNKTLLNGPFGFCTSFTSQSGQIPAFKINHR